MGLLEELLNYKGALPVKYIAAGIFSMLFIITFAISIATFNKEEARNQLGEIYVQANDWITIDNKESVKEDVSLPIKCTKGKKYITASKTISKNYAGGTLYLETGNASVKVYIDDNVIYGKKRAEASSINSNRGSIERIDNTDSLNNDTDINDNSSSDNNNSTDARDDTSSTDRSSKTGTITSESSKENDTKKIASDNNEDRSFDSNTGNSKGSIVKISSDSDTTSDGSKNSDITSGDTGEQKNNIDNKSDNNSSSKDDNGSLPTVQQDGKDRSADSDNQINQITDNNSANSTREVSDGKNLEQTAEDENSTNNTDMSEAPENASLIKVDEENNSTPENAPDSNFGADDGTINYNTPKIKVSDTLKSSLIEISEDKTVVPICPPNGTTLITIPNNINDGAVLTVVVYKSTPFFSASIKNIAISSAYSMALWRIKTSTPSVAVCIILFVLAIIILSFEIIHHISKSDTSRHPGILAVLCMAFSAFLLMRTGVLQVFLGNEKTLGIILAFSMSILPVAFAMYIYNAYVEFVPKIVTGIMIASAACFIFSFISSVLLQLSPYPMQALLCLITYAAIFITSIIPAIKGAIDTGYYLITAIGFMGHLFILLSLFIMQFPFMKAGSSTDPKLQSYISVLGFIILAIQQTYITATEYKERTSAFAEELKEGKEQAEKEKEKADEAREAAEAAKRNADRAKRAAEEAKKRAQSADDAKSSFLANMSHEIRTPINAILGMDELILRATKEPDTREKAQDIFTAGHTLLSLINDILDFSKIESGRMEIIPVEYDLASMINDLSNMASLRAKDKGLKFILDINPNVPSKYRGDDIRIKQILTNILTNAVKYTQEGSVVLSVAPVEDRRMSDVDYKLRFSVKDTGIGIKPEDLPKLTEEYRRIEEERNRTTEGTGLGMSITVSLLSLMNSHIEVESIYGSGSTFSFVLKQPIADPNPIGDINERFARKDQKYSYESTFYAPGIKILFVDDNDINRKVFAGLLEPTGVTIREASSGKQSIEVANSEKFDIIFMDHMMPGMDGIEATRIIKQTSNLNKDTPIYILTANAVTGAKENYLKMGFDGYLSKPISSNKLEEVVKSLIPKDSIQRDSSRKNTSKKKENIMDNIVKKQTVVQNMPDEELPDIDGVDWDAALSKIPNKKLLKDNVIEFSAQIIPQAKKLNSFYKKLPDEEALNSYRIQVHSMKSSSAAFGMFPSSGMAKVLEDAAKTGDIDTIKRLHSSFINVWTGYANKLKVIAGDQNSQTAKPPANPETVSAILKDLMAYLSDFNMQSADSALRELTAFAYGNNTQNVIEELKTAVANMDAMAASGPAGKLALAAKNGQLNQ